MAERIVILGAGHAGGATAIALRDLGFSGPITLVGDEAHPPYERPSLSKDYLSGAEAEPVWLAPVERWAELDVTLKLGVEAIAIDRDRGEIRLADGSTAVFDKLVLAMGGRVRRLPMADHPAVRYLRTADDARAIAAAAKSGARALVIGGGVIGLEAASTLRGLGMSATVIETGERLLGRNVTPEAAGWLADAHARIGVEIKLGRSLQGLDDAVDGSVLARLDDGSTIEADLIVVGIGIIPATELAEAAGLPVAGGVLVGDDYRSPADDRIFAVGDLAARTRDGAAARMETWAHAQTSARTAALAILGRPSEPEPTPWFWTAQCGHNLQILGDPPAGDSVISRGEAVRLHLRDGVLVGAVCLDQPRDFAGARRLIGKVLNVEAAGDPSVDLRKAAA
ncbi:NAD(P)/FAD-dependent oxidoreductase [Brevundimonas guildfordensis]|uniref:FAD-dependent oxidoreductase n=1 Tax=Brevundimonas guildfordensis TaxID=2762241 RepID=A0ABR8QX73_9CAUL|nr:FAD-dependent oxidoreductase [Brevundimonas guildfordensis]MBD7940032.1 FAD-dependent oxidoreductase [Brevundimonas guildfordensis]